MSFLNPLELGNSNPPPPTPSATYLLQQNNLSEFANNPAAQLQAQANIGLAGTNALAHFILAST